jgi:hypothetical protein
LEGKSEHVADLAPEPLETGEIEPPEDEETEPEATPESGALPPDFQRALTWF